MGRAGRERGSDRGQERIEEEEKLVVPVAYRAQHRFCQQAGKHLRAELSTKTSH